jgi:hypothetical protein
VSIERTTSKIIEAICFRERFEFVDNCSAFARFKRHLSLYADQVKEAHRLHLLAVSFRDAALAENIGKRTGAMRRFVYLCTENKRKLEEFVRVFDRYGIEVLQTPKLEVASAIVTALLHAKTKELVPVAILREESVLAKPGTNEFSSKRPGVKAEHLSVLHAQYLNAAGLVSAKEYTHSTQGVMRQRPALSVWSTEVFDWDDQFELQVTGLTYQEHLQRDGLKISSRDMVISMFLNDRVYYKQLRNLKHHSVILKRPVDISIDVATHVCQEPHYNTPTALSFGLGNMLNHVLNEGIFFKGADTRLMANYWQPGLNAGLPLVEKKDPIHEETFMLHDLGHFLMKDLIFTGRDTPLHRNVYIIHRMISEAITIMLADGLFVESMRRERIEYDFSERKIFPLFQATGLKFTQSTFLDDLRTILKASVDYTVKGDESKFKDLIRAAGANMESFESYKAKFEPFFVSDLQWTVHNYENMTSRTSEMRLWWDITGPVRDKLDIPLETIDEFIAEMPKYHPPSASAMSTAPLCGLEVSMLVDRVFESVFNRRILPIFQSVETGTVITEELLPFEKRRKRGFLRYMIGQLGIFARFWTVPMTQRYYDLVVNLIIADAPIDQIRSSFENFVTALGGKNLISLDDVHNFKDMYPLFEPFYVTYDKNEKYPDLGNRLYLLFALSLCVHLRL